MILTIAPAMFARTLELARAALDGAEAVTISMRYGLAMPADRLVRMTEAVALARGELNDLEELAACEHPRAVH